MTEEQVISHLEIIRADIRDEMKRRIEQRDKYSMQMILSLSAVMTIAFSEPDFQRILIITPMISLYFTVLILYSYRIHGVLASYLKDAVEPRLAELCGLELELEWEHYYQSKEVPGVRKSFFIIAVAIVSLSTFVYLFSVELTNNTTFVYVLAVAFVVYAGLTIAMGRFLRKNPQDARSSNKKSQL